MSLPQSNQNVLTAIQKALSQAISDPRFGDTMAKSTFSQSASATSGLTFYDLEGGAKSLVPILTPLRNVIPRVSGRGGIQANWRAITGLNAGGSRIGVSAGNRGANMSIQTTDYIAVYKGIGVEANVDFEAEYAGMSFDDMRSQAALRGLQAAMLGEEGVILGGNNSINLGATPTPTLAATATGGTLASGTLSVICVALSLDGFVNASVISGIQAAITRTNADGSSDTFGGGAAQKSTNATIAVTGPTGTVTASIIPVRGAFGYAWFWGTAGSETLGAITSIASLAITSNPSGTQMASSLPNADWSTNNLVFDGLLTLAAKPGSNAYFSVQPNGPAGIGTPLTSDGAGGIVEIDQALKSMWDYWRLSPDTIWVNSQEALNISKKILAGGSNSAQRFVFNEQQNAVGGGIMVRTYLNRFSMAGGTTLDVRVHPNLPAGTILMTTSSLPYSVSGIGNVMQIRTRQDYYQIEWPIRSRRYEYGIYADEVLQHYAPFSLATISNIGNG